MPVRGKTMDRSIDTRMNIFALTWPIWIETALRMAFMSVDVFMLSAYSDRAVAAVGVMSQLGFFLIILFMTISAGAGILISQANGAAKTQEAAKMAMAGTAMAAVFGIILSIIVRLFTRPIIGLFGMEADVSGYARDYLAIFGTFSFTIALSTVFTSILRSYGYSKQPMYINMAANLLNVLGNYLFIFGPFGIPILGVTGVAISTVVSRGLGALAMLIVILKKDDIPFSLSRLLEIRFSEIKKILSLGIPHAGENLSFNLAQMVSLWAISRMGTASLSAYSYAVSISRFIFMTPFAIGQGTMVQVGYLVGAGRYDDAYRKVLRYFAVAAVISVVMAGVVAALRFPLTRLFTDDSEIIALTAAILLYSLVYEPGRTINLVIISGIKGAGDMKYPVTVALISMWTLAVGGSLALGLGLGIGVLGVFIAFSADEWVRGFFMLLRWKSRQWERASGGRRKGQP